MNIAKHSNFASLVLVSVLLTGCLDGPAESGFSNVDDPITAPCEVGGGSALLVEEGILASATHYECAPRSTAGTGPFFYDHEGVTTLVAGGSTELEIFFEGWQNATAGRLMLMEVADEWGYYAFQLAATADEQDAFAVLEEFFIRPDAPGGEFEVRIAFDDGTGTAAQPNPIQWYRIRFDIVPTEGGVLQFALNWNTATDVDLHVVDPSGEIVFYGNPSSASGGELDLDSNAGCELDGVGNENVIWDVEAVPEGDYQVAVNLWSACNVTSDTDWRLTILSAGEPVETIEGEIPATAENPEANPLPVVTTFSYP